MNNDYIFETECLAVRIFEPEDDPYGNGMLIYKTER